MSANAQPPIEAQRQSVTGLAGLLGSVISAGKGILARRRQATAEAPSGDLLAKCRQLLHHRGEASGLALNMVSLRNRLKRLMFFSPKEHCPSGHSLGHAHAAEVQWRM